MGPDEVGVRGQEGQIGGKFYGEKLVESLELDGGEKMGAFGGWGFGPGERERRVERVAEEEEESEDED